jgi:hypothetical protein
MEPYPWTCPFCGRDTTITDPNHLEYSEALHVDNAEGPRHVRLQFVVCPNAKCKRFTLTVGLYEAYQAAKYDWRTGALLASWRLIPPSQAKVYPDYVPKAIRDDYQEACLICDASPKASATLSRRCLQGMIRHFWKVKGNNLKEEIEAIKDKVEPLTWDAIDSVRNVGNIGAHMEKDINLIIEVGPGEAGLLVWLIEHLVKDWYINRHEREERLRALKAVGDAKAGAKSATTEAT